MVWKPNQTRTSLFRTNSKLLWYSQVYTSCIKSECTCFYCRKYPIRSRSWPLYHKLAQTPGRLDNFQVPDQTPKLHSKKAGYPLCRFFYSTPIISASALPASLPPFLFFDVHCKNEQHMFNALEPSTKARLRLKSEPSKFREPQAHYLHLDPPLHLNEIRNSSVVARRPGMSISRCTTLENNILDSTHDCRLPWLHIGGCLC
jgi:hypothetical protein